MKQVLRHLSPVVLVAHQWKGWLRARVSRDRTAFSFSAHSDARYSSGFNLAWGGFTHCHAWPQSHDQGPLHPCNVGTEHVGFSPIRKTLLAPSAKRREVFDAQGKKGFLKLHASWARVREHLLAWAGRGRQPPTTSNAGCAHQVSSC